jgi:tape measure domain-containing protein
MSTITSEIKLRIKTEGDAALTGLGAKLTNLANQATASSEKFRGLAAELRNVQSTTVQSTNNLKAYSASWRELAGSVDIASKEFREATAEAAKLDAQLAKIAEAARLDAQLAKVEGRGGRGGRLAGAAQAVGTISAASIFGGPEGALGASIGFGLGGPAGAIIGAGIGAQVGQLRQALGATGEYSAELTKLQIALSGVSENTADYEKNLKSVNELSNQFLIPLKDTTQQFTKLQASVIGAGMQSKVTETVFKGIASATLATGGSIEDLNSALRATAQVFSKGKVSAEELRQQIGERLPGAFTIFASSIGKTPQELDKALERGEVTLEDFVKFSEELFKRYGKTAEIILTAPQNAGLRLSLELDKINVIIGRFTQPVGAAFQTLGADIVKGLAPALESLANLIDAPKQLASERLKQIERQIREKNTEIIKSRMSREDQIIKDSFLYNLFKGNEENINKQIKALKGEKMRLELAANKTEEEKRQKQLQQKLEEEKEIKKIKEKAIISLRELEEKTINDLADLREKQIKRALDLERQFADQRLKVEREIQDIRQERVYIQEDMEYLKEIKKLRDLGLSTAGLEAGQKTKELLRDFDRERIKIQRESEDDNQQRQRTLEAFKKTNADEIGKIQLDYTRKSSDILQKTGDQLKKSMGEGAKDLKKGAESFKDIVQNHVLIYIRRMFGYPAKKPDDDARPSIPNLPPPTRSIPFSQQIDAPSTSRPIPLANSRAAGVGMIIPESMTKPQTYRQQINVIPYKGVESEADKYEKAKQVKQKENLQFVLEKELKVLENRLSEINKPLQDQKKLYEDQKKDIERITQLIRSGVTPSLAEQYLQIEKIGAARKDELKKLLEIINSNDYLKKFEEEDLDALDLKRQELEKEISQNDKLLDRYKAQGAEVEKLKTSSASIKELWNGISETIGRGVGQAIDLLIKGTDDLKTSLQNIASGILKDIANQISSLFIVQPIVAGLKSLFPFAAGGVMTSQGPMPLKRYGVGGIANSPQLAIYGEGRMPEAYVPLPDGRRIPVAMQGGSIGTTNVIVNVDASGTSIQGNAPRGDQLGKALSAAVQVELVKQRRPGGLLA